MIRLRLAALPMGALLLLVPALVILSTLILVPGALLSPVRSLILLSSIRSLILLWPPSPVWRPFSPILGNTIAPHRRARGMEGTSALAKC